jgi:hypothetical protein
VSGWVNVRWELNAIERACEMANKNVALYAARGEDSIEGRVRKVTRRDKRDLIGSLANELRSGVIVLVNSVTKSHKHALASLNILDKLGNFVDSSNLFQHVQHRLKQTLGGAVKKKERKGGEREGEKKKMECTSFAPPCRGP